MHKYYFPPCNIEGEIEPPVPYGHLASHGAIPNKCSTCNHLFEGGCTRNINEVGRYLHLDHGPCSINGPTDPVIFEDEFIKAKVEIPRKCRTCHFLSISKFFGFYCSQDKEKWGDLHRGLDWGAWKPNSIYLELPPPKVTTKALSDCVSNDNQLEFIKEYRRVNPGLSIKEAKLDYIKLRSILEKAS